MVSFLKLLLRLYKRMPLFLEKHTSVFVFGSKESRCLQIILKQFRGKKMYLWKGSQKEGERGNGKAKVAEC